MLMKLAPLFEAANMTPLEEGSLTPKWFRKLRRLAASTLQLLAIPQGDDRAGVFVNWGPLER